MIRILSLLTLIAAFSACAKKEAPTNRPVGTVTGCQRVPAFLSEIGFTQKASFTTGDRKIQGLILQEGEKKYQHPTWKSAGSLAPISLDGEGNVFVAPAPWIDLVENAPKDQNKLYKVDSNTQEMKLFAELPRAAEPVSENPYGVLGLAFDCDTNSVYVSSVSGSTRKAENGSIFQVNANTGKIISQFDKTDAFGIGVFNSSKGKRLYFSSARRADIRSIALDADGKFTGEAIYVATLQDLGPRGDDRGRRITFTNDQMRVAGLEFDFNMIAPLEKPETPYHFAYDAFQDRWTFIPRPPEVVK